MTLSELDIRQLESIGKPTKAAEQELLVYAAGIPAVHLERACALDDGILALNDAQQRKFSERFEEARINGRAMKFVAASGAASRMFSAQRACLDQGWVTREGLSEKSAQDDPNARECLELVQNLPRFPFFDELKAMLYSRGFDIEDLIAAGDFRAVLEGVLSPEGLGYADRPKGLIPFYRYPDGPRTAFEEHLVESAGYLRDRKGVANLHFTVAPRHLLSVADHLRNAAARFGSKDTRYEFSLSVQPGSTDSIVVDLDNKPLRDTRGMLVFRPSGHGALLENLNSLKGDILFIRTIDNVLPDRLREMASDQRGVLGGILAALQEELSHLLRSFSPDEMDEATVRRMEVFAETRMNLRLHPEFFQKSVREKARVLYRRLNAPLRVCGMVRNPGYPGGRPFWTVDREGIESLQIIEPAQVDSGDARQRQVWESCEFFNPADLVCGVRDYLGRPFNLAEYRDPGFGFIARRTCEGVECRILEQPGLWNGSMAHWNTVFVEVPAFMVRPVKTVLDLLEK